MGGWDGKAEEEERPSEVAQAANSNTKMLQGRKSDPITWPFVYFGRVKKHDFDSPRAMPWLNLEKAIARWINIYLHILVN